MYHQPNRRVEAPGIIYFRRPSEPVAHWGLLVCMLVGGFVAGIGTERVIGPKNPKVFLIGESHGEQPDCSYESLKEMLVLVRDSMNEALVEESLEASAPEVRRVSSERVVQVTTANAKLQSAPSDRASVVAKVAAGTELLVREARNDWVEVYAPSGGVGWIKASLVNSSVEARGQ